MANQSGWNDQRRDLAGDYETNNIQDRLDRPDAYRRNAEGRTSGSRFDQRDDYGFAGPSAGDDFDRNRSFGERGSATFDRGGYDGAGQGRYGKDFVQSAYGQRGGYRPDEMYRQSQYGAFGPDYRYGFDSDARQAREPRGFWDRTADEVSSWFGDDAASSRRRQDERVAGAHRGKGPKDYTRSDERIREDVNDRLTYDPHIDATGVSIAVKDGEVTLTGNVNHRNEKRHAEDLSESVAGVKHVQNNLRVHDTNYDAQISQSGSEAYAGRAGSASGATTSRTN